MNDQCAREPQVREWTNRLGEMTEVALATQEELAMRISPITRSEPEVGTVKHAEKEVQLVPMAAVLRDICDKVGRLIERNQELTRKLEI